MIDRVGDYSRHLTSNRARSVMEGPVRRSSIVIRESITTDVGAPFFFNETEIAPLGKRKIKIFQKFFSVRIGGRAAP